MKLVLRLLAFLILLIVLLVAGWTALNWAPDRPVEALQARWAPPPSTFIEADGLRIHLRDEGPRDDPQPIVLLHGTSASLHTWDGWAEALRGQRRVIRFDMVGFGLTGPAPDNDYRIQRYSQTLVAVLDKLGVQQCVLAGNSLGGYVAWYTAATQPQRVAKLVLVDAGGYPYESQSVPVAFRVAQVPGLNQLMKHVLPRSMVESSVRNVYGDPARVTPELVDRYYELTLREGNRGGLVARFKQGSPGQFTSLLGQIKMPTLILWGSEDRLIPPSHGQRFAQDVKGSKLVMFEGLGHVPQEEDAARTVQALQDFLRQP